MATIDRAVEENLDAWIAELSDFCARPSVAATGGSLAETAQHLAGMLEKRGFVVQILQTPGAPIVYAEGGSGERTLLLYNHYDVQPAEPLELWTTPPFELALRDGRLYARGVADDKGQIVCRLAAIDTVLATRGELPCRVKVVVEGEEEIGSVHLPDFVEEHADLLAADVCLWEGGGVDFKGQPSMVGGARGMLYVEFEVESLAFDAHSGKANLFPNAAWRLVWALSTLKGRDERVAIPGFYVDVLPPSARDLELLQESVDLEQQRMAQQLMGVDRYLGGKSGLDASRQVFEPTSNIAGLESGYIGEGAKTIIPSRARAKMDFRLVPDQDPYDIAEKLRRHLDEQGFADVRFEILGAEFPGKTDPDDPYFQMCACAAEEVYGKPYRISPLMGGTGPVHPFIHHLGTPILSGGCGSPADMIHAPNENISLEAFVQGVRHIARVICRIPDVQALSGRLDSTPRTAR